MSTEASSNTAPPKPVDGCPCFIEIMSVDPPKLKQFYAALFPAWEWTPTPEHYKDKEDDIAMYMFKEPKNLGGAVIKLPPGCERGDQPMGIGSTVYYYVDSLEEVEKKALELGGKTVLGKTKEGKDGWFMNFKDPEGNRFGVYTHANWTPGCSGAGNA